MEKRKAITISASFAIIFSGIISLAVWFLIFSSYETEEAKYYPIIVFIMLFIAQTIWGYVSIKRRMK